MIVKFKTLIGSDEIERYFQITKVPFESQDPFYYLGVFGSLTDQIVTPFTNVSLEQLALELKLYLSRFGVSITNVTYHTLNDSETSMRDIVASVLT